MNDPLAVIYNESYWRVNKVSFMYNLQYNEVKLKQYGTIIRHALTKCDVGPNADSQFTVAVECLSTLKYSHDDPSGLQITVTSNSNSRKSNNKEVYVAILLSWGRFTHTLEETTHLPYMLERGDKRVGDTVMNTMQRTFDCNIIPFHFTMAQLVYFLFNFVENDTSKSTDPFVLSYRRPQVNLKKEVHLTFEVGDIRSIWNMIKEETHEDQDKRSYAYQSLQNQIYYMYKLDVTLLHLCEVALPKAEVKSGGVIKMKTPEIINSVFTVLNDIVFDSNNRFQI